MSRAPARRPPSLVVVRLGQGGDYRPRTGDLRARELFLEAVARVVPQALADLKAVAVDDEAGIESWCQRYGFRAPRPSGTDWLRRTAAYTRRYLELPATQERPQFLMAPFSYWDFEVRFTWRLFTERRTAWLARMAQETTAAAERPDLVPVAEIRVPAGTDPRRPFEWLALHQCAGWSYSKIAAFYDPPADADVTAPFVSPETIRQATLRVARHVDLELRRGSPGRPRTTPTRRR